MADPATALIGIAGTAAGGIIQGIGAGQSAAASSAAYTYKAGVAQMNAQINDTNATYAIEEGAIKSQEVGLAGAQEIANTEVTQAAGGFDVNKGTNVAVRGSQAAAVTYDQQVIQWDSARTAWGYEAKAATDQAEGQLDTMAASTQKTAGLLGEIGSFISGGTSVATKWSQGTSSGALTGINNSIKGMFF